MHNSTFKNPGKGLKRSAFKPKADAKGLARGTPLRASAKAKTPVRLVASPALRERAPVDADAPQKQKAKPRSTLRTRRPTTSKIRQSARNETCTLCLPGVCKVEPGNVVWAHSNRGEHGKAGGMKAHDEHGAYACYWCHCVYDRQHPRPVGMTLEFVENEFTRAMRESRAILVRKGLVRPLEQPLEVLLQDSAQGILVDVPGNARLAGFGDDPYL